MLLAKVVNVPPFGVLTSHHSNSQAVFQHLLANGIPQNACTFGNKFVLYCIVLYCNAMHCVVLYCIYPCITQRHCR